MGLCLRGKMADMGLTAPAPVAEPAAQASVADEPATALAEPQLEVTPPPATPAVPENLIAATFGLLRAEPDGSVVIAGSGTPGSEVEIYSNGTLLGRATVESSGDWVLVPDQPIPPGGTELTLAEAGKQGRAAQSFVVVINEDKTSEPLVVASTPGAASEILQGVEQPEASATTAVAALADPAPPVSAPPPTPAAEPEPAAAADEPSPASQPATSAVSQPTHQPAFPADEPVPVVEPEVAAAAPTEPATSLEESAVSSEPVTPDAAEPLAGSDEAEPERTVATADPASPAPTAPQGALEGVPPTIDAIEIEGNSTFFAGGGPEGAPMRLYVDGKYIADAMVAGGRWLVEAGNVLTASSQRIRVDMLKPGSAEVTARAEVDFVVDLPATEAAVAAVPATEPAPAPSTEPAFQPEAVAPAMQADSMPLAPGEPAMPPATPAEPQLAGAPEADTVHPAPVVPQISVLEIPAAQVPAEPASETAPPLETAVEGDVPTMVAVPVGDPEAQRFASGRAIIRRGDNLWTIARRVYGAGIKYTAIYEANTGQIRDPNRIYPGQVFDLPKSAD